MYCPFKMSNSNMKSHEDWKCETYVCGWYIDEGSNRGCAIKVLATEIKKDKK